MAEDWVVALCIALEKSLDQYELQFLGQVISSNGLDSLATLRTFSDVLDRDSMSDEFVATYPLRNDNQQGMTKGGRAKLWTFLRNSAKEHSLIPVPSVLYLPPLDISNRAQWAVLYPSSHLTQLTCWKDYPDRTQSARWIPKPHWAKSPPRNKFVTSADFGSDWQLIRSKVNGLMIVSGPLVWNRLGVSYRGSLDGLIIYNSETTCHIKSGFCSGRGVTFKIVDFPLDVKPTWEWYIVDMCNNLDIVNVDEFEWVQSVKIYQAEHAVDVGLILHYMKLIGSESTKRLISRIFLKFIHDIPTVMGPVRTLADEREVPTKYILWEYWVAHLLYLLGDHRPFFTGSAALLMAFSILPRSSRDIDLNLRPDGSPEIWQYPPGQDIDRERERRDIFIEQLEGLQDFKPIVFGEHSYCASLSTSCPLDNDVIVEVELQHKQVALSQKLPITSRLHEHYLSLPGNEYVDTRSTVECVHPRQILLEKLHAIAAGYTSQYTKKEIPLKKYVKHIPDAWFIIQSLDLHEACPTTLQPGQEKYWPWQELYSFLREKRVIKVEIYAGMAPFNLQNASGSWITEMTREYSEFSSAFVGKKAKDLLDFVTCMTAIHEALSTIFRI